MLNLCHFPFFVLLLVPMLTFAQSEPTMPKEIRDKFLFPAIGEEFPFAAVSKIEIDGLMFNPEEDYRLVLDMTDNISDKDRVFTPLTRAARTFNLNIANGLPLEKFHMAIVIHASALDAFFSNDAYQKAYKKDNPNLPLIKKMQELGVEMYVCGQNMAWRNLDKSQLAPGVKVALSAKTALVYFDHEGYMYMDMN